MSRAAVFGAGSWGTAFSLVLADAGIRVRVIEAADTLGGGTRSAELTLPGLVHDVCAAIHPMAVATRFSQAFDLAEELTVGRAAGCQVRVDDTYASQLHARIFRKDAVLFVEDLGSTNGTYLNRRGTQNKEKVTGPLALKLGDRLMIGKTVLEVAK